MLEVLDALALRRWCHAGLEALTAAREEIDALNVYPVPDGDTGTNLLLTMASVVEAVEAAPPDLASTVRAMAHGSLMGARGNSGVILSQLLRGLGDAISDLESVGPDELRTALVQSAASAYTAVAVPVEGTVLTVARAAADAALGVDLAAVVRSVRTAGAAALARTTEQLPALRAAGVVDAGGRGWCVLLEALELVVTGAVPVAAPTMIVPRSRSGQPVEREAGSDAFAYEVQFLLRDTVDEDIRILKQQLRALGDSLVVVGAEGLYNVHVHVNDVGAALEAAVDAGRPFRISVTRFSDKIASASPRGGRAVVAVASGQGLATLFRDAGADVVEGGPSANPSTAELLDAIRRSGASEVVLLPNDGNIRAVATAAADQARRDGLSVAVVPTRSVLQGLAAASVADADKAFDDDVATMGSAAGATRWAEVTTAVRDALTMVGPCAAGDVLGLLEGDIAVIGDDVEQVGRDLLHRMLEGGGELATVVVGAQSDLETGQRLADYLAGAHPAVEVLVLHGGQPHYPFLLGVE